MIEKNTIKKGPPKRDETCYQVQYDIVILAGTILRAAGDKKYSARVGEKGEFILEVPDGISLVGFKRVIAA